MSDFEDRPDLPLEDLLEDPERDPLEDVGYLGSTYLASYPVES